ncbi:MAG: chorismate synthase, partial [Lachnospiraceae bacterium]|nr:chorismate synthase [Lachnospiraceae bacterium]
VFRCVIKPASSISLPQDTVDVLSGRETTIRVRGRHDPCIACRACPVVDGVTALVLCDLMALRYGTDWTDVSEGTQDRHI